MRIFHLFYFFQVFFLSLSYAQQIQLDFEAFINKNWIESSYNHWQIDTITPISGRASLHHSFNSDEAGNDIIAYYHDNLFFDSLRTTWKFKIKHGYAPSSANNWAFWLATYNDVKFLYPYGFANGYLVGVNFIGADDKLKIWRQQEGKIYEIISTDFNWQENILPDSSATILVERDINGLWSLFIDIHNTDKWQKLGTCTDNNILYSSGFGLFYKYSSSQDQKLWIDDIFVKGAFYKDLEEPEIDTFFILKNNTIEIRFNEEVDTNTVFKSVLNRSDEAAGYYWKNNQELVLFYEKSFQTNNLFEMYGIKDLKGNTADYLRIEFVYYLPEKFDVVFSEIMSDPFPSAGLPECEYIELANITDFNINIKDWVLEVGEKSYIFDDYLFKANSYLLIIDKNCINDYEIENKYLFNSFSGISNTGTILQLRNNRGNTIHAMEYSNELFKTDSKREGGWSLEMIDLRKACSGNSNWSESISYNGGSPGKSNSVKDNFVDSITPYVKRISTLDEKLLEIEFSEQMDDLTLPDKRNYSIPDILIDTVIVTGLFFNQVHIFLHDPLVIGELYNLSLSSSVSDCSGNLLFNEELILGLPEIADSGDLVINEIMFESTEEIPEFIELFNRSEKIIEIRNYTIGFFDDFSESWTKHVSITSTPIQILPGDFFVITERRKSLFDYYNIATQNRSIYQSNWQTLPNSGAKIALIMPDATISDIAIFEESMHFSLLNSTKGVSLERLSVESPGIIKDNWHSASSPFYATPGDTNSQRQIIQSATDAFSIDSKEITPDNDGQNDILNISYNMPKPGFITTILIFNAQGQFIREISNNELCGITGNYFWDGTGQYGEKLDMGYYVLLCRAIHTDGDKIQEKETILLLPEKK